MLGHGPDEAHVEEALSILWRGTGFVTRGGRVERGLAALAFGVWGTDNPDVRQLYLDREKTHLAAQVTY